MNGGGSGDGRGRGADRNSAPDDPLLRVENLCTQFPTESGTVRAVDGVSFEVRRGETVCLVGESGSGKSVAAESVTRIFDPPGRVEGGQVVFDGRDLTAAAANELREVRGGRIGHVFQNPDGSLNPVYTVGEQVAEAVRLHEDVGRRAARARAVEMLDRVGIPEPAARADDYPHELSGGMKQRVAVATALACRPDLLIADEPTTALDVTTQASLLELLADLQSEFDMGVLLVTHDLGVVAEVADRVVVLYAGKVMERADVFDLFESPAHPYTRALLSCFRVDGGGIPGTPPDPTDPPKGCRFHPRCPRAVDECRSGAQPPHVPVGGGAGSTSDGRTASGDEGGEARDVSCVHYLPGDDPAKLPDERAEEADGRRNTETGPGTGTEIGGGDG